MMYTIYIINSTLHDLHYIGHTANLEDRLKRHNENRSPFTKGKRPWQLVICKNYLSGRALRLISRRGR
ncbi:MAG: GIY-YIG nuclease family protein [Ignavibacteriales bacterium]|nr:GIY-YIG nuclease family protein [Ignavibacteriales bacterium]